MRATLPLLVVTVAWPAAARADIEGVVEYRGESPITKPVDMTADPTCKRIAPRARSEEILVDDGRLANVFAYVKNPPDKAYVPRGRVYLKKSGCRMSPRVFGIQVGQKLIVTNEDPTLHSVRLHTAAPVTRRLPEKGDRLSYRFTAPQVMTRITCDVHTWMSAYAGVLPHPFFGVSGEDGAVRIPTEGLPEGTYEVGLWHETLGEKTLELRVEGGQGRFRAVYGD